VLQQTMPVHSLAVSVTQTVLGPMVRCVVNWKYLEGIGSDLIEMHPGIFLERPIKTTETPTQDRSCYGRDSNRAPF
jgi:hypothetical protein